MTIPGFTAELSLNTARATYTSGQLRERHLPAGVVPAALKDPCSGKIGCALARCECREAGGDTVPNGRAYCGFLCE